MGIYSHHYILCSQKQHIPVTLAAKMRYKANGVWRTEGVAGGVDQQRAAAAAWGRGGEVQRAAKLQVHGGAEGGGQLLRRGEGKGVDLQRGGRNRG